MIINSIQKIYVLFIMFFLHIVDDYYLQGILASMKQRLWWRKQEDYNNKHKNDYIAALICHSFSWSFMIMLPLNILTYFSNIWLIIILIANFFIHCLIDNEKANLKRINLNEDQFLHFVQIFCTWSIGISLIIE